MKTQRTSVANRAWKAAQAEHSPSAGIVSVDPLPWSAVLVHGLPVENISGRGMARCEASHGNVLPARWFAR
jgi:hypothetical protein